MITMCFFPGMFPKKHLAVGKSFSHGLFPGKTPSNCEELQSMGGHLKNAKYLAS